MSKKENYQNNLHMGIGAALIFPAALVTVIIFATRLQKKTVNGWR